MDIEKNLIRVMITQEWSYFNMQLDMPISKQIKMHILRDESNKSLCGLTNITDEGEIEETILDDESCCKKCLNKYRNGQK